MKRKALLPTSKAMPASGRGNSQHLSLEASELRYRRLFETAQDGILILDGESGRITDVNPFLLDLLDYSFESLVGLQLWEIGQFRDITANQAAFENLQENEYIRYENLPLRTKSGKQIHVEFVSNVYFVDSKKVIQCNIRDITDRAEAQTATQKHLTTLELAGQAKDEVISVLSHELRTPLTAISSMVDLIEMENGLMDAEDPEKGAPHVNRSAVTLIRRNAQNLVRLINDLLDLNHIAKGALHLNLEAVNVHEIIDFAVKNLESQRKTKGIELHLDLQAQRPYIRADALKLEQIITNLVSNALKFTPEGGFVAVATRNEADWQLLIDVTDTGIGIAKPALPRIFSPFEQGDSSIHPRFGGLGLGLAIARSLIEAHDGSLEAASLGLNRGAKFTARFKVDDSLFGKRLEIAYENPNSATALRILLVEDNEEARLCVGSLLESEGYSVETAKDMRTAFALNKRNTFDLLITDLGLPDGSGRDLLQEMRVTAPHLEGIAVSGYGSPHDIRETKEAGYLAHLVKPVAFPKLHTAIKTLYGQVMDAAQRRLQA
ncbi:MAG: ATP-binding protein [Verrucomicrobiota bacterium]